MTSRTATSRALLALAATTLGLTLTACGGSDAAPAASEAAPASSAAAPSSSAPAESPAASPSASAGGTSEVKKVCDVLSADEVSKLTGVKVKKGASTDLGPSNICQWTPSDTSDADAAIFSGQEGPLPGPLSQVEGQLKQEFDGTVDEISVEGADEARYIVGKKSGVNVIDVLAAKDDVFYQVLVAAPRDVKQHKDGAVKIAEALIKA